MFRQFTMILLAFAVLLGGAHAASWSHEHGDDAAHGLVVAHADDRADNHDGDHGQMAGQEEPSDFADVKGDVVGHHSHPVGMMVAAVAHDLGVVANGTKIAPGSVSELASFSQAPLTQPPSA